MPQIKVIYQYCHTKGSNVSNLRFINLLESMALVFNDIKNKHKKIGFFMKTSVI